tara:strand:+ start:87 stop:731 length:645 start_codon:yes stop_codon:yes gene_type:complete
MDEEITIINTKTRNEKIKSFFIENKKILLVVSIFLILILISFNVFKIYKDSQREKLSNKYNNAIIKFKNSENSETILSLNEIIEAEDSTYSPLALYFLIDNNLIEDKAEINNLFDILIEKTSLEKEVKNLIIYKKALYNADTSGENELLNILNPLINSKSVWKSHALYLMAEFFYSKNEKEKSREFFTKIITSENANADLSREAQKRLNRDLSE